MASFNFDGIDLISVKFEELSQISDEEKMSVIWPAAELLRDRQMQKLSELFRKVSGSLAASISISKKSDEDGVYAHIVPKGKHPASGKGIRKHIHSNGDSSGTNAEIAYILEYGSPRIPASHWMEKTNEEAEAELVAVQQEAWNDLMERKGF